MTHTEFSATLSSPIITAKLEALGLVREEAEDLFALLDPTGSGRIKTSDFMSACRQLVTGTKQKDIVQVSMAIDTLNKRLCRLEGKFTGLEDDVDNLADRSQTFLDETLRLLTGYDG